MQPEPTQDAVAATQSFIDNTPAPPEPAQQQPAAPTPQPTPSQQPADPTGQPQDPFASLFAQEPVAPTESTPAPQPTQPTEPTPNPQPSSTPTEPSQPTPAAPQAPATPPTSQGGEDDYLTFDEYMKQATGNIGQAAELPDAAKINPDDPNAIKGFFDELVKTARDQAVAEVRRETNIQNSENKLWNDAFTKYGSLKTNKGLRDMVHNMRMGYFNRGIAITPTQAADKVLEIFNANYKKGIADNQVQTKIEQVQPTGGNSGQPVPTSADTTKVLESLQTGGEQALQDYLNTEIQAGRL